MNADKTNLQHKVSEITSQNRELVQRSQQHQQQPQAVAKDQSRTGPASGDRQTGQSAVEKLSQKNRAALEGIRANMRASGVQGEKSTSPPAKNQESDFNFNRQRGLHKGNVIAPAATQVQQNSTMAQQPTAENKTPAAARAMSKQEVLDQAKAYAQKAASRQAASQAKAADKGQQKEQANAVRKAPAKGRDR
jgi:hypothetical protein